MPKNSRLTTPIFAECIIIIKDACYVVRNARVMRILECKNGLSHEDGREVAFQLGCW